MIRLANGFVFACDLERMVQFYEGAFAMTCERSSHADFVVMRFADGGAGVAIHAVPAHIRSQIQLDDPAQWRDDSAYKLSFATDDLDGLRAAILAHGGQAKEPWSWEGRRYCECTDPEGNVVQIVADGETTLM